MVGLARVICISPHAQMEAVLAIENTLWALGYIVYGVCAAYGTYDSVSLAAASYRLRACVNTPCEALHGEGCREQ